jgi:hypothetical protein
MMADDKRASDKWGPTEIFNRLDPDPSFPLTVFTNFSRMSLFIYKIKTFLMTYNLVLGNTGCWVAYKQGARELKKRLT